MRLLYPGDVFSRANSKGIQRYVRGLLSAVGPGIKGTMLSQPAPVSPLPSNVEELKLRSRHTLWGKIRGVRSLVSAADRAFLHKNAKRFDLFHSFFFEPNPVSSLPSVVTVHDMNVEKFPELCGDWGREQREQKRKALIKASYCVCVSQSTADDLIQFYPGLVGKIALTPNGTEHLPFASDFSRPNRREEFLLYVGERKAYKNFGLILKAMALKDWPRNVFLVVAGPDWETYERNEIKNLGLENRIRNVIHPNDRALRLLYENALALAVPSKGEGFCLPVTEAFAAGTAVLCGEEKIYREISPEGAMRFATEHPEALLAATRKMLNPGERTQRIALGQTEVRRFTWAESARTLRSVYQHVAPC